jgi:hypothetical protein
MPASLHIGLLIFPNVTQLDFTGPLQVFSSVQGAKVHLIWKRIEPVQSDSVLVLTPTVTFADCPQLDAGLRAQMPWGSAAPRVVGEQVPIRPDCAQLTQGPVQEVLQQKPSAQKPEAHCDPALQTAPVGLGPQLPFTHFEPTQSLSEAQVAAQVPVLESQLKGAQMTVGPAVQVP